MVISIIIIFIVNFIKLPYYLNLPGEAYELSPIVKVDGGDKATGEFLMTTVGVSRGQINPYTYVWSHISSNLELIPAEDMRVEGESDKEYYYRQLHAMDLSQNVAIAVAYEKAGKEVAYKYNGVYVMSIVKGMDAEKKLEVGDRIYELNGKPLESSEQFIETVGSLKKGDTVTVSLERDDKKLEKVISLMPFPEDTAKVGVGISLVTDREISVDPDVEFDTSAVGGPSAGLMFTLEIINQLTEGDLTKGHKIAGTGTIDYDGKVGPIGGIVHKVVAADKAGAEYFFAPRAHFNYDDAIRKATEIKTEMKVIPVDTLDDALNYLESMK
ncbi:PDZ domain-containing protein [Bacillus sp. RD4P76]|uniref:endopeptidase La n=1 Tax=Bacillus suaedaesalsae TaxID=2810349 RepID=A0ABS2DM63_9BACI|nr:PDZ domain-containing protein [Bacillus suaedaesalsae]